MKRISLFLSIATLAYSWYLQHPTSCNHYIYNSTTLSFVCTQALYQYELSAINHTPDSEQSLPLLRQYNLNQNFKTIIQISDENILGSANDCTSFRLTYTYCNPLTLTRIEGLSQQITTSNNLWFDEIQFDYPYLFLFDISTDILEVQDVSSQTQVTKATDTFQGSDFRLQVTRITEDTNLILLYHAVHSNQVYEFNRNSHTLTQVSSFENPINGQVADAEMYGSFIVYVHFSLIMVFKHEEHRDTRLTCELQDTSTEERFTSDFKKRVQFTENSEYVFGTFQNEDFLYVISIYKEIGSCFVKGYQFENKEISFGFQSNNDVYAFMEFESEVERQNKDNFNYILEVHRPFKFEAWMIVLILIPLIIIIVVVIVLCVVSGDIIEQVLKRRKKQKYSQEERSETFRKKDVIKLEIEQQD